jgi:7-cyano-7-deazaguanine synthase in queuosine biosynthesis
MQLDIRKLFLDPGDQNVIVFLSGGVESTLLAKLCLEIYGPDKTILISILTQDYGAGTTNSQPIKSILSNIINAEKILGVEALKFEKMPPALTKSKEHYDMVFSKLLSSFNAAYIIMGRLRTEFEIIEILKKSSDHSQNLQFLINYCTDTLPDHLHIFKEHHMALPTLVPELQKIFNHVTSQIYNTWNDYTISPFRDLYKYQIVLLYKELGLLEILYKTRSCIEASVLEDLHCGKCFNCQQRYDAITAANLPDLTKYQSNDVILKLQHHDKALEKILIDIKSNNDSRIV